MPPTDLFFAELPAQIDNPAVPEMGKVAEPEVDIFHNNTQFMTRAEIRADVLKALDVMGTDRCAASVVGIGRGFLHFLASLKQDTFPLLDSGQMGLELRDQLICFKERKDSVWSGFVVVVRHATSVCLCNIFRIQGTSGSPTKAEMMIWGRRWVGGGQVVRQ
jgi:hypothetical protein